MGLSLRERLAGPQLEKWFHYTNRGANIVRCEEKEARFSVKLKFCTPRRLKELMADSAMRQATDAEGLKALVTDRDAMTRSLVYENMTDWKMTVSGAYAVQFEGDLVGLDPSETIDFTPDNVKLLAESSRLCEVVESLYNQGTTAFFDDPAGKKDEKKNPTTGSKSGASGNTDAQPAGAASTGI